MACLVGQNFSASLWEPAGAKNTTSASFKNVNAQAYALILPWIILVIVMAFL